MGDTPQWLLENSVLKVTVSRSNFSLTILDKRSGAVWESVEPGKEVEATADGKACNFGLSAVAVREVQPVRMQGCQGFRFRLGKPSGGQLEDVGVWVEYLLAERSPSLRVSVIPAVQKTDYTLGWLNYPRPFAIPQKPDSYLVLPYFQGAIVPGDWPTKFREGWPLNAAQWTMPWFGAVRGKAGMIALVDTPYDAWFVAHNPEGGPPTVGVHWEGAHQYLRYTRSVTFEFFDKADYVTLAKRYRRYAQQSNQRFCSWQQKVKKWPQARSLPGRPAVEITFILNHDVRTQPPLHVVQRTFDRAAAELQELYDGGWRNLLPHVDGWGQRGYDNYHPDVIPPCPEAGGYEGLSRYTAKAKELGYTLELHDNYRDYYLDAPSFSEQYTIKGTDAKSPRWSYWAGGPQSVLCGKVALQFLRSNMEALKNHTALPGSLYFDVFDAAPVDECSDPAHAMTREECVTARQRCLDYTTSLGMVCASEGGSDWSVPHTTHVNSVAITQFGIQVPLYSLVYHDATIVYGWFFGGASELSCALHSFAPRVTPFVWKPWQEPVERLCELNRRLAGVEMTGHRFFSQTKTTQETTFANGAKVEADFDKQRYRVTGLRNFSTDWHNALVMGFPTRVRVSKFEPLPGGQFRVTFEWETKTKLPPSTRCFVHFLHPKCPRPGGIVWGLDHPLPQAADTWSPGQRITDGPYTTGLPESCPEGDCSIIIGLLCPSGFKFPERLPLYWDKPTPTGNVPLGRLIVDRGNTAQVRFEAAEGSLW